MPRLLQVVCLAPLIGGACARPTDTKPSAGAPVPAVPATTTSPASVPDAIESPITSPSLPVELNRDVVLGSPIVDYALGTTSCVVHDTGRVSCWGQSPFEDDAYRPPFSIEGIDDAVEIGARPAWGGFLLRHADGSLSVLPENEPVPGVRATRLCADACMIDESGARHCMVDRITAKKATDPAAVLDCAAADHHECSLLAGGRVACRGSNGYGQLGVASGAEQAIADMPTAGPEGAQLVVGLTNAVDVAVGAEHSCALLKSGQVTCWGSGYQGNTGPGEPPLRGKRRIVDGLSEVMEIDAAEYGWTTCAIERDSDVVCWGMSDAWSDAAADELLRLPPLPGARRLDVARDRVCAIDGQGVLHCFGSPRTMSLVTIGGLGPAREVVTNAEHACAWLEDGDVWCWGEVEVPDGRYTSTHFTAEPMKRASGATSIAGGRTPSRLADFCVTTTANTVECVGTHRAPHGFQDAVQVAMGQSHVCARRASGEVDCWGSNARFQLGHPDSDYYSEENGDPARPVNGLPPVVDLAAGGDTTCAIAKDGQVYCWGDAEVLGDGSAEGAHRHSPQPVPGLRAAELAMEFSYACARTVDERVACWGYNSSGRVGQPADDVDRIMVGTPFFVPLSGIERMFVGEVSCGLRGGGLTCWGQLPNALADVLGRPSRDEPFFEIALPPVKSFDHTRDYACMVDAAGAVKCFGDDEHGSVGTGARARWLPMMTVQSD